MKDDEAEKEKGRLIRSANVLGQTTNIADGEKSPSKMMRLSQSNFFSDMHKSQKQIREEEVKHIKDKDISLGMKTQK